MRKESAVSTLLSVIFLSRPALLSSVDMDKNEHKVCSYEKNNEARLSS